MKIVTAEQMQRIDRLAAGQGLTPAMLMEIAGKLVAEELKKAAGSVTGKRILVAVGPGNNGGDGLVAARYLYDWGADIIVYLCKERAFDDKNLIRLAERGVPIIHADRDITCVELDKALKQVEIIVDAVFGTGRTRVIDGSFKTVLIRIGAAKEDRPDILLCAVDMPSGMNADTGEVDPSCPRADITVTLGYPKPGFYAFPGSDYAGKVIIADIGIPSGLADDVTVNLITSDMVRDILPRRPSNANKGTFGKVLIIAGSMNYIGAAYLACMGAARCGAGLVTLAAAKSLVPVLAAKLTETTYLPLPEKDGAIAPGAISVIKDILEGYDAVLIGCGLGQRKQTAAFVTSFTDICSRRSEQIIIYDADALNILSQVPRWWQKLSGDVILTPHPGEMSRLCGVAVEEIQRKRMETAGQYAKQWNKVVVLKGAYSVVAAPDGQQAINALAYAGLASAGTGDVLAGIIAGLAAQGLSPFNAALSGVYIHGEAGLKAGQSTGPAGLMAGDIIPLIPGVIKGINDSTV